MVKMQISNLRMLQNYRKYTILAKIHWKIKTYPLLSSFFWKDNINNINTNNKLKINGPQRSHYCNNLEFFLYNRK